MATDIIQEMEVSNDQSVPLPITAPKKDDGSATVSITNVSTYPYADEYALSTKTTTTPYQDYVSGVVDVGSTPIEAKVGATRLAGRKGLTITNVGFTHIHRGHSTSISDDHPILYRHQYVHIDVGDIPVYIVANDPYYPYVGDGKVAIEEWA